MNRSILAFIVVQIFSCQGKNSNLRANFHETDEAKGKDSDSHAPETNPPTDRVPEQSANPTEQPQIYNTLKITYINESGGSTVGNGGDAVLCYQDDGKTIASASLLDFYEINFRQWLVQKPLTTDLGSPSLTTKEKLDLAIKKLRKMDPVRADNYARELKIFWENTNFMKNSKLENVPDSAHIGKGTNCHIEQLALQNYKQKYGEKYYAINNDLYDLLSPDHQAGLILHEIIYHEYLQYHPQATDSVDIRAFVVLLTSKWMDSISQEEYFLQLDQNHIPRFFGHLPILEWKNTIDFKTTGIVALPMSLDFNKQYIKVRRHAPIVFSEDDIVAINDVEEITSPTRERGNFTCRTRNETQTIQVNFILNEISKIRANDAINCRFNSIIKTELISEFYTKKIDISYHDTVIYNAEVKDLRSIFYYYQNSTAYALSPCPNTSTFFDSRGNIQYLSHCPDDSLMLQSSLTLNSLDNTEFYSLSRKWLFGFTDQGLFKANSL